MPDYISIGKIVAVFGLKGEVILQHALGKKTALKGVKAFFIQDKSESWFPWFIKEAKAKNNIQIYLSVEDVNTPEEAKKLLQKTVWLKEEDFEQHAAPAAAVSLIGYSVIHKKQNLGEITEVIKQPHQILCTIIIAGKEVFIPLHNETVQKVDRTKKCVYVDLPEGLLELYL